MTPEDLIRELDRRYVLRSETPVSGLAEIAFGSVSSTHVSGRPKIKFDGESADSTKTYPYNPNYTPVASDRVLLLRKPGGTWVVMCKFT